MLVQKSFRRFVTFVKVAVPTAAFLVPVVAGVAAAYAQEAVIPAPSPNPLPSIPAPSVVPIPSALPSLPLPELPDLPLSYRVHTVYEAPGGARIERYTDALLLVPTPVDVDGTLGADEAPELLAQLTIDAGRATVRFTTLPTAPARMPLLVEAIVADPRGTTELQVAYGYDALMATAPATFSSTIQLVGTDRITSFALDIETAGAGDTLAVIGEVYEDGANGERLDPQRGRVQYTPVPNASHVGLLQGSDFGIQQSGVDITSTIPTMVEVLIEDIQGSRVVRTSLDIDSVPNLLSLILTESEDGRNTWSYTASARVESLRLSIAETRAGVIVDDFAIRLQGMSTRVLLIQDTPTHATFESDAPIGVVEVGSADGRAIAWLDEPAYLYQTDRGGDSFAFRILGLSRAEFDSGDPFLIDVDIAPGPFHVLIEDGARTIDGRILDLPGHVRIEFSAESGTLDYEGSEPIGAILVDITDPTGVSGRATELHLALREVPETLSLAFGADGGVAMLDARPGRIGSVDLLLTSGPVIEVDEGFDGVVQRDVPSHYALVAKLTGLELVSVTTGDAPYLLELQKDAGPFLIDLVDGTRSIRIEILDLPEQLAASFDPSGAVDYEASDRIELITVDASDPNGLSGRATDLDLRIEDVPAELSLDFGTEDAALIDAHGARIGSIELLLTSGPVIEVDAGYDGIVLEDVPSHEALVARLTGLRLASVTTASPYTLDLRKDAGPFVARLTQGERFTEVLVHDLPDSLQATFDPAGSLTYTGSATIDEFLATVRDPAGVSGRATNLELRIEGLPQELTLDLPASGRTSLDAHGAAIELIDVLLTSGPDLALPTGYDGVVLRDTDDVFALAVQLHGLRFASLTTDEPYDLTLRKAAGPFLVDLLQGPRATVLEVLDLPDDITVSLDPKGAASYVASAPIGHVGLTIDDPTGVTGRATAVRLTLEDLPSSLDLTYGGEVNASVDAHGARIGLIDLLVTSGPELAVADGYDGVLLVDTDDAYVLAARITGLRLASVATTAPYALDLRKDAGPFLIDLTQQQRTTWIEIVDLPDSLQATLDPETGGLSLDASAPIGRITAMLDDPAGVSGRATALRLTVTDIPTELDLTFGSGETTSIDAHGQRIGMIDVLLTSGPWIAVADGYDGVLLEDVPSHYALAARITGLRLAQVTTASPYTLDLRKDAGPFLIDLTQGPRTTRVEIVDLPDSLQASIDPEAGTAGYTASAPIEMLDIAIADPAGVSGRATRLALHLDGLPASLDLSFLEGGAAGVDAHGAAIGKIDLLLTSGPTIIVPVGFDGLVLEDLASHYALAARITGLRSARISTGSPYELTIAKNAGPFLVHLEQGAREVLVTVRDLPSSVSAVLDPNGTLTYTGSASIAQLDATVTDPAGIAGRATRLELALRGIPTNLTMDFGTTSATGIDAHGAQIGSIDLLATSGPDLQVDAGYEGVVLEDVPSHFAVAARLTGLKVARVTTGSAPYMLTLQKSPGPFLARLVQGARTTLVRIHDLPSSLTASLNPAGSLAYTASAPVGEISAEITDPAGVTGRATRATALLRDVPAALDVSWSSSNGTVGADARGATVGLLEVLLTSGPNATLPADRDGLVLEDLADRYVLFGRLTGLRRVTFTQGPPPAFDLQTIGGRLFEVSLRTQKPSGVAVTSALIDRLPAQVAIAFSSSTSLTYRASAPVSSVTLDAFDPDGISGRAKELHASLTSLPVALDASWTSGGTITLDARGGTVGLIELQLTSGPNDRLPTSVDGILLNDLADRYVVFARITGLRRLVGTQAPSPDITLSTTGGRVLQVELNQLDGGKVEYTRATLTTLPQTVRVRVAGQQLFYDASAPTSSLVLDTNSGDRWNLHADIRDPVPAHLQFCAAGDGFCTGYRRSSGAGSFYIDASEHTSVNLFDCVRPLNASCARGNASEFAQVDNWRVRHFEFDADADDVGFSGYTYNDTNGHALQGYLRYMGSDMGFEADIRPGYWSQDRKVEWDAWGLFKDKDGSVNCAGSSFSIRVLGIWIGVTGYVC